MNKHLVVAYFLWINGGFFGIHLFYLGRDHQGVLWLTSFAGIFGLGWLRDFYRIPAYVREANGDSEFVLAYRTELRRRKRPSVWSNIHRVIAQVLFGLFYRTLVYFSLPEEYSSVTYIVLLLVPLGTAFGAYMVSNSGTIKSRFKYSLIGAYVGEVFFGHPHLLVDHSYPSLAAGVCSLLVTFAWEYDRRPRGNNIVRAEGCCKRTCKRLFAWTFCAVLFSTLLCSAFYFNATVETEDGETVKVREALNNFFRSPHWKQIKESFWRSISDIWQEFREKGWEGARKRILVLADVQGEDRSRLILGIEEGVAVTTKILKAKYRELAKEWHPDHHRGTSEKEKVRVQERFMEIKDAYENLMSILKRRESRTSFFDMDDE